MVPLILPSVKMNNEDYIKKLRNRVKALQKRPQPAQRSDMWYKLRTKAITASEAASCLTKSQKVCEPYVKEFGISNFKYKEDEPLNPYETKEDYIIKKCNSYFGEHVFIDSVHTLWGKKYEEVANRLYCQLNGVKVIEFGLVPHGRIKWLAASPDGITEDGVMLEIKCPKSRKINEGYPPIYYYVQTQIQLEVCNLDVCDFLECEITELQDKDAFEELAKQETTKPLSLGVVLKVVTDDENETEPKYLYPPLEVRTPKEHIEWMDSIQSDSSESFVPTYYHISKYNIMRIKRSKEWFNNVKDDLKQTHDIIMKLQKNKEDFEKYKETMEMLKNREYWEVYHKTSCEIEDASTYVYTETHTTQHITRHTHTLEETLVSIQTNNQYKQVECDIDSD